jgi:hypothetical protein
MGLNKFHILAGSQGGRDLDGEAPRTAGVKSMEVGRLGGGEGNSHATVLPHGWAEWVPKKRGPPFPIAYDNAS